MDFVVGDLYSRNDIKTLAGLGAGAKGGNWDTGIVEHDQEFILFANVGTEGRTGHDYGNEWIGNKLRWFHKVGSTLSWPSVQRLLQPKVRVHAFARDRNDAPFEYMGIATAEQVADTSPVEVVWGFDVVNKGNVTVLDPTELPSATYQIGAAKHVLVNAYERDSRARQDCVKHFGYRCVVCDFSFEDFYGEVGIGFTHVHHLVPLYMAGEGYVLDPVKDLRPVCANCHAMIHRRRPPFAIEELKSAMTLTAKHG